MDRRQFLHLAALAAATSGCGGGSGSGTPPAPPPPGAPNVLVLVIDDLNDWVGYLGNTQAKTPNMDRLAARSTAFMRNYCNEPLCNPSRASAWTGLSPQNTGVYDNFTNVAQTNPAARLLPDWMAAHGFQVAQYGKINHKYTGFDEPHPATLPATNQQCSGYPTVPAEGLFDWAAMDIDESQMEDYKYASEGISFLQQSHDTPFMLCVGLVRTHLAWYVPKQYVDLFPADQVQVPDVPPDDLADIPSMGRQVALFQNAQACITGQGLWADAVRHYLASIAFVDAQVGRVLDALDASAHAADTIVVLWSDNGFHLGEKFHWHKQALWEQTTRVPLIIRTPGQSTGARVTSAVSLLDTMPTLLDLTGVPAPYALDGRSLRPLLSDATTPWDHPVLMTNAAMDAQNHSALGTSFDYAIRTNQYRYIRYRDGGQELYDDLADPSEFTNVASDPGRAALMAQLDALMPPPTS
jgi:arylsulfatase A-like enzyme